MSLESAIEPFGREIFKQIVNEQSSAFNKNYWSGEILKWSMTRPELKLNLFRLVDVLPALNTAPEVAAHVTEYLANAAGDIHKVVSWSLRTHPHSMRARVIAFMVRKGVAQMASQFIAGRNAEEAGGKLLKLRREGLAFTVDLLGEFSVSERESRAYLDRYLEAITSISKIFAGEKESAPIVALHPADKNPLCISVKLSALYSQTSPLNFDRSVAILAARLSLIVHQVTAAGGQIYVDAEDSANNAVIYATWKKVFSSPEFKHLPYPGIVVQAYAKGSYDCIQDLLSFARQRGVPIAIRLVKGAYWDQESILAQQNNWPSPLFCNKESSDANFERIAELLIDNAASCLPAFASHNVRSLSHACCYARSRGLAAKDLELQMLYGMADPIVQAFRGQGYLVRLYVPLGEMLPGMGYLVRRLLENTSNESFLRHTFFEEAEVGKLLRKPVLGE